MEKTSKEQQRYKKLGKAREEKKNELILYTNQAQF